MPVEAKWICPKFVRFENVGGPEPRSISAPLRNSPAPRSGIVPRFQQDPVAARLAPTVPHRSSMTPVIPSTPAPRDPVFMDFNRTPFLVIWEMTRACALALRALPGRGDAPP